VHDFHAGPAPTWHALAGPGRRWTAAAAAITLTVAAASTSGGAMTWTDRSPAGAVRVGVRRAGPLALALCGALAVVLAGAGVASAAPTPSPTSPPPSSSSTGTLVRVDFEDGTTGGFTGDPAAVSVRTTSVDGSVRLSVSGLTGYGQGAGLALPGDLPAGYYGARATVRLASGQAQDVRIALPDSPRVSTIQNGITRSVATGWAGVTTYFGLGAGSQPVQLRVEPVAHCADAPAVPLPYLVDDVTLAYYGTIPPPLPQLPTPSCPLGSPTTTTSPPPSPTCEIDWTTSGWNGGYQAALKVTNLTSAPVTGWRLTWTFRGGETLQALWPAGYRQDGAAVTVTNPPWNPTLGAGQSVSLGFVANNPNAFALAPTDIALNGAHCRFPIV
jgi:cellulase/cellobiase CelA1